MTSLTRILVVEDQPLLLLDLIDQLSDFGLDTVSASSARTAARMLDDSVDALITDIELGDGPDGLALARLAALHHPGLPMVVVSGGVQPDAADLPQNAVFIPKPYKVEDILSALNRQSIARAA